MLIKSRLKAAFFYSGVWEKYVSIKTLFVTGLIVTALAGCSGTYNAYEDMIKLALNPLPDVQLTYQQVIDSQADFMYVKMGDIPQAALALGLIEGSQFKWVSGDRILVVTENGRIVRTSGLANDLLHLTNTTSDPLKLPGQLSSNSSWLRLADWQHGEYGYQIRSSFKLLPGQTLTFFGHEIAVTPVVENLSYDNATGFLRLDGQWQNQFWLDPDTGIVLKSRQILAPGKDPFDIVYISAIARKLQAAGVVVVAEAK